ncbi:MAG: lytic transglycosylase domain-containing protein [Clostridiales bacterium]|jgi:soluble lytic murein transglycosylase|nr:lytic transglycosylase domain-containing protein [Clostridiales bacterium]
MNKEQTQEISRVGIRSVESVKAAMRSKKRTARHHRTGEPLTTVEKWIKIGIPCILLVIGGILAIIFLAGGPRGLEQQLEKNEIFAKKMYPEKYAEFVVPEAIKNGLEPELVYAIIKAESDFNPEAVSSVGAMGLMQMTPSTFEWVQTMIPSDPAYEKEALFDPEVSIRYGCKYLAWNLKKFGDLETALCAYNAGPGNVSQWLKTKQYSTDGKTLQYIPFKDTEAYVENVMRYYEKYKELYHNYEQEVSSTL